MDDVAVLVSLVVEEGRPAAAAPPVPFLVIGFGITAVIWRLHRWARIAREE